MAKRIGILGGMTAESTVSYYLHIVRTWQREHGNHAYPEIAIDSLSFQPMEDWMEAGEWDQVAGALEAGLTRLGRAGADFAVIATNTMHLLFDRLQRASDALAELGETIGFVKEIRRAGRIGLLKIILRLIAGVEDEGDGSGR